MLFPFFLGEQKLGTYAIVLLSEFNISYTHCSYSSVVNETAEISSGYTPTHLCWHDVGVSGHKDDWEWQRLRGMGTDSDMKRSKVMETWVEMMSSHINHMHSFTYKYAKKWFDLETRAYNKHLS